MKEADGMIELEEPEKNNQQMSSDGILQVNYIPTLLSNPPSGKRKYFIRNG